MPRSPAGRQVPAPAEAQERLPRGIVVRYQYENDPRRLMRGSTRRRTRPGFFYVLAQMDAGEPLIGWSGPYKSEFAARRAFDKTQVRPWEPPVQQLAECRRAA
jgi:hypothetical protein